MISLRPSASHRWLNCLGSQSLINALYKAKKIKYETSVYAEEGTKAHAIAEAFLNGDKGPFNELRDADMREAIVEYLDLVHGHVKSLTDSDLYIEYQVPLFYDPGTKGTVDAAIIADDGSKIVIDDLKYGKGVEVPAVGNTQMAIYGWSLYVELMDLYGFTKDTLFVFNICQPRIEDSLKTWAITAEELQGTIEKITQAVKDVNAGDNTFNPSESACRFCEAAAFCQPRANFLLGELPNEPTIDDTEEVEEMVTETFDNPLGLGPEKLVKILAISKDLRKWLDRVEGCVAADMYEGTKYPGYKLVEARTLRKWFDPEVAATFLKKTFSKAQVINEKVVSPAAVEKLCKGKRMRSKTLEAIQGMVVKPEGAPVVVPETDKRPELTFDVSEEFDSE